MIDNQTLKQKQTLLYVETEAQIRLDEDKFPTDQLSSVFRRVFTLYNSYKDFVRTLDNLTL